MIYNTNYTKESIIEDCELVNPNELLEQFIYDEVSRMPDAERKAWLESDQCRLLQEKGIFRRNTLVKLSKTDDLDRRIGMAALKIAKDKNDPLFQKLAKNRIKERELLDAINAKYASQAERAAKVSQREWMKTARQAGNPNTLH